MSENQPNPLDVSHAMWADDRASQSHGFVLVDATENSATLSAVVREDMVNGLGVCHGGILFLFADSAMAYATKMEECEIWKGRMKEGAWFGFTPAIVPFTAEASKDEKKVKIARAHLDMCISWRYTKS